MRFLVDAQPPPALARWIESQGHSEELLRRFALLFPQVLAALAQGETLIEIR